MKLKEYITFFNVKKNKNYKNILNVRIGITPITNEWACYITVPPLEFQRIKARNTEQLDIKYKNKLYNEFVILTPVHKLILIFN